MDPDKKKFMLTIWLACKNHQRRKKLIYQKLLGYLNVLYLPEVCPLTNVLSLKFKARGKNYKNLYLVTPTRVPPDSQLYSSSTHSGPPLSPFEHDFQVN